MRSQTAVSPLLVVFALVAGGSVGGVLGVLVAIPLAAGLRVFALLVVAPAVRRAMGVTEPQGADGDHREEDEEE